MVLSAAITEESDNLKDARLVGLFLNYLEKENALTAEETAEAARFDRVIASLTCTEDAWDEYDLRIAANKLFFPNEPNHLVPKPNCPGACCATFGANCSIWGVYVVFV